MNRRLLSIIGFPLFLAACGGATGLYGGGSSTPVPSASQTSPAPATISVRGSSLGQILVDGNGKTLYLFEADTSAQSTCSAACAQAWPPFTTHAAPKASGGASPSLLGTTLRSDGTTQVTYGGHPLYFFISDTKPGDTSGEGVTAFGAGWDVLSTAGDKIEKPGA